MRTAALPAAPRGFSAVVIGLKLASDIAMIRLLPLYF
jgi:hypothetical protein